MTKKPVANPFALLVGPNRYILDQQMPALHDHLYQRMQLSTFFVKIDEMRPNRLIVIGGHWARFASNNRDPFGIRCPG